MLMKMVLEETGLIFAINRSEGWYNMIGYPKY